MATSDVKIEDCEVCGATKAKYTCPKCEVRTCSLSCVNIHKKELECDGIRDKTKFIPIKSFTDLNILSDYRLLEEVGRSVDKFKSNPLKKCTRQSVPLPVHLNKLKAAAFRRKINLQYMPSNFSRHKLNTTYLNWKTNELFWRIEWIFPQAENTKWVTERALESTRLSNLVEEIINPVQALGNKTDIEEINLGMTLNERLQYYRAAGLSGIKVFLKAEKTKKSNSKFYDLEVTLTLSENLENKVIIEFPTLFVVLKDHADMYEIIDTDNEENESECTSRSTKRKRGISDSNKQKDSSSSVNYFFNSDVSDSDEERKNKEPQSRNSYSGFGIPEYSELIKMEQ